MSRVDLHMLESLKNHVLEEVAGAPFPMFKLHQPGTCVYFIRLTFLPEGIVITGDMMWGGGNCALNGRALCSSSGYGVGWFSGKLSEDYLCEKFLRPNQWSRERALEAALDEIRQARRDGDRDAVHSWAKIVRLLRGSYDDDASFAMHDLMVDEGMETADGLPGYGYDDASAGWLCAIQQTFARLRAA